MAVLASFLTLFMVSSINVALPAIGREFHMSVVVTIPENYPLFLTSPRTAFSIFIAACFAGVYASLARRKMR